VIGHSQTLATVALFSPVAAIIQESRHLLVGGLSLGDAMGSDALVLVPLAILVATTWLGLYVFDRMAPRAAEEL
jgi:ABC-type polysaccharide/polyol phosphate export permease